MCEKVEPKGGQGGQGPCRFGYDAQGFYSLKWDYQEESTFSIDQHDIKRMVPEHWHSRLQGLCRWVLCCVLWLPEYKSPMKCAAAAGFMDSKEDYVLWGSAFLPLSSLSFFKKNFFKWKHSTSQRDGAISLQPKWKGGLRQSHNNSGQRGLSWPPHLLHHFHLT